MSLELRHRGSFVRVPRSRRTVILGSGTPASQLTTALSVPSLPWRPWEGGRSNVGGYPTPGRNAAGYMWSTATSDRIKQRSFFRLRSSGQPTISACLGGGSARMTSSSACRTAVTSKSARACRILPEGIATIDPPIRQISDSMSSDVTNTEVVSETPSGMKAEGRALPFDGMNALR